MKKSTDSNFSASVCQAVLPCAAAQMLRENVSDICPPKIGVNPHTPQQNPEPFGFRLVANPPRFLPARWSGA